jgi:hypothetical protein
MRVPWIVLSVMMLGTAHEASAALCRTKAGVLTERDACKKKESPVTADQVGAKGDDGLVGPQGPAGPPGPQGPAGSSGGLDPIHPYVSAVLSARIEGISQQPIVTAGTGATAEVLPVAGVLRVRFPGVDVSKCVYLVGNYDIAGRGTGLKDVGSNALIKSALIPGLVLDNNGQPTDPTAVGWPIGDADEVDIDFDPGDFAEFRANLSRNISTVSLMVSCKEIHPSPIKGGTTLQEDK